MTAADAIDRHLTRTTGGWCFRLGSTIYGHAADDWPDEWGVK